MASLIRQVALVSESSRVSFDEVAVVSAALQKQALRDLAPVWDISASVDPFARLEDVPLGYWPMIVKDNIGFPGAAGIHLDKDGQPYALITSSNDNDIWSLTASHELLEMLVDPFGNQLEEGDSPKPDQGRVQFLVEVCDPSEAAQYAYTVNGVLVSDFYTPRYFDPVASPAIRYSFTNSIKEPRDVLPGGYLSWLEPVSGDWWQETWFGNVHNFRNLGPLDASNGSFRSQIDNITYQATEEAILPGRAATMAAGLASNVGRTDAQKASHAKAVALHAQIAKISAADEEHASTQTVDRRRAGRRK